MTTRHVHALRIVAALPADQRANIALDPIGGIEDLDYEVVAEPALTSQRGAGGWCDGMSFADQNTVMYAPTPGSKKENFTLLHEVAHILVENDDDALIWLADCDNYEVELERLCEQIAAALVVPEDLIDEVVGTGPPTGEDLKTLVTRSAASGPACTIALSSRLSSGAVVLIDRIAGTVIHSALRGEDLKVYPWKGTQVPDGHPLLNLEPGSGMTSRQYWVDTWGRRQELLRQRSCHGEAHLRHLQRHRPVERRPISRRSGAFREVERAAADHPLRLRLLRQSIRMAV